VSGPSHQTPRSARAYATAGVAWLVIYALLAHLGVLAADLLYQVPVTATALVMARVGFARGIADRRRHAALVGGVVSLADRVGLPLVAEGVETAGQLEALRDLGCAFAQGYHLGRPGPLAAVDGRTRSLR
jgi:EAL domain-containing protein (putative c-di-GMP-specific phosphodiesterase class I)